MGGGFSPQAPDTRRLWLTGVSVSSDCRCVEMREVNIVLQVVFIGQNMESNAQSDFLKRQLGYCDPCGEHAAFFQHYVPDNFVIGLQKSVLITAIHSTLFNINHLLCAQAHLLVYFSKSGRGFGRFGEISPFVGFGPQTTLGGK